MQRLRLFRILLWVALVLVLLFFMLPVVAIMTQSKPSDIFASLKDPVAFDALRLSLQTTFISVCITGVFGTLAAWIIATGNIKARSMITTIIELPLVLPPAVAGIALLVALGPNSFLGGFFSDVGIQLVLTSAGVVIAITFVSAPFYLRQAIAAFCSIEQANIDVARCLGASETKILFRVVIPAARGPLLTGLALTWARAVGEFGATLMFAGSFRGITQTLPLAIYTQFATDFQAAIAMSVLMVAISAVVLFTVKFAGGKDSLDRV